MLNADKNITISQLNALLKDTLSDSLGMEVTEIGDKTLTMKMPVDKRTVQSHGVLHGGASIALAETVASLASNMVVMPEKRCAGIEINGNHLRVITKGWVFGKAIPIHLGSTTHVWSVEITNEDGQMICISRITIAILGSSVQ